MALKIILILLKQIENKSRDANLSRSLISLLDIGDSINIHVGRLGYIKIEIFF